MKMTMYTILLLLSAGAAPAQTNTIRVKAGEDMMEVLGKEI